MNEQNKTQMQTRETLEEVSSIKITGNSKLDALIRIRELLTKIEESELIKSEISEDQFYDYFNLSLALRNIETTSEIELGIFRVLSSHFDKKAAKLNYILDDKSQVKKSLKK